MLHETPFFHKGERWTRVTEDPYAMWIVGCDIGKSVDYTALVAMRHTRVPLDERDSNSWITDKRTRKTKQKVAERFTICGVHRLPLGLDYDVQGARIRQLLEAPPLNSEADLVIDDNGVGGPVGDILATGGQLNPVRVTTNGTVTEVVRKGYRKYVVPKILIISHLDARLSSKELLINDDLGASNVARDEFANFQQKVSPRGHFTFEAGGGKHDDIVSAAGLALFWAIQKRKINLGRVGTVIGLI